MMHKPSNIDKYIAGFPKEVQAILEQVRATVKQVAPDAEEVISYGIPTFRLHKTNLVHFAAFKNHIGFYPTPTGSEAFKEELSGYKTGKGSVQFPLDHPMPLDLIARIVAFRVKQNSGDAKKKRTPAAKSKKTAITVKNTVNAPVSKVWKFWTEAEHIRNWNNASDDWHCPKALNDLRVGGHFVFTMAAKDGSFSFDFEGDYDEVVENKRIAYTMSDGRKAEVTFQADGDSTHVVETFDAENIHSHEMQRAGWQSILDNFKKYAEQTQ